MKQICYSGHHFLEKMWTVAASNKRFKGSLGNYNGLTDQHLAHYFSSPVIKAHLIKTGLVTKDGIIIPESDLKVHCIQKQKKQDYQELLANAIVQKALYMEQARQAKIRQHLEDIAKIELVERIKRPHTVGTVSKACKQPTMAGSPYQYSCSSTSLKGSLVTTKRARSSDYAHQKRKIKSSRKLSRSVSSSKSRNSDYDLAFRSLGNISPFKFQEGSMAYMRNKKVNESKCQVTLYYHGNKIFWWMNKWKDEGQEIVIKQQHCGGNPVVVFKGTKIGKENLTFTSQRHAGYPFSITIFIDGLRDLKLSACCEYRYQRGSRLGGKAGHFSFISAEGGRPCAMCQEIETKFVSRSPFAFLPRNSHQVSSLNADIKSEPRNYFYIPSTADAKSMDEENFTFTKEDNESHTGSEVHEEEPKETVTDNANDIEEVPDEVESAKPNSDVENPVSPVEDESPDSIKSESDNPASEVNEAYSEVDAGPEQCVDLEYDSGGEEDSVSHGTASSASNAAKQISPSKTSAKPHALNLDVRSMSEDEGAEEHIVIAEVHASDTSEI